MKNYEYIIHNSEKEKEKTGSIADVMADISIVDKRDNNSLRVYGADYEVVVTGSWHQFAPYDVKVLNRLHNAHWAAVCYVGSRVEVQKIIEAFC